ncbi:MAG: hypothetical protein COB67_11040 [SAR324 cluster bacterium]|uniref:Cytochrome C n=1 Tax=SAR324 cluster bacterium TaxID=2024889 RepID=A0A2A4SUX0_9DELT|nr:MAG: hypothetical protein COB67_11040 [SAR324 cluster bacterium]
MNQNIKARLLVSKVLAVIAIVLFMATYFGGEPFAYRGPDGEVFFDEDNLSWQPMEIFIDMEEADILETDEELKTVLGKSFKDYFPNGIRLYDYVPTGWRAYLGGYHTMPIWKVTLDAPQYPKAAYPEGIAVYFTLTDFRGEVTEMNTINHYIGMDPMDVGGLYLRKIVPFGILALVLLVFVYIFYTGPGWKLLGLIPAGIPFYFLGMFSYMLYWFGHNLHEYGQFDIKPFMPTVLGDGKVAQFVTHAFPAVGFYTLLGVFICMMLSVLIRRKALKEAGQ